MWGNVQYLPQYISQSALNKILYTSVRIIYMLLSVSLNGMSESQGQWECLIHLSI